MGVGLWVKPTRAPTPTLAYGSWAWAWAWAYCIYNFWAKNHLSFWVGLDPTRFVTGLSVGFS